MKLLFVCAANAQRSPSFKLWFKKNRPQYDVRSAGVYFGYPYRVDGETLEWADTVYVMDLEQYMFIYRKYPEYLLKVKVVGCSDQYSRESDEINELIWFWANKIEGL